MIKSELYFDFRRINREDYSEQIKFYESNLSSLEVKNSFNDLRSRNEFIRRVFILYYCALAFNETNNFTKALSIFDFLIDVIENNHKKYNIDLKREYYYINSIFEKGKALYNLGNYRNAKNTFRRIINTGQANHLHGTWYISSRNAWLFRNLNNFILILAFILLIVPDFFFAVQSSEKRTSLVISIILFLFYYLNPASKLSNYLGKKFAQKFNDSLDNRTDNITYYSNKIRENPNDYSAYIERGIAYSIRDEYEKSLNDMERALAINPINYDGLYYRAIAFNELKKYKESIQDLTKLIDLKYENLAEIYFNRGDNFMMLNNFELALEDFNKAIELEPFYPYYIFYRAYLYQDNGYNAEAINDYDRVLLYNPEDYVAMTNRGEAYYALGNKNAAFLDFTKAKEFDYKEAIENLKKLEF